MTAKNQAGISLVILSYERMAGLKSLLKSLQKQKLDDLRLEIIVCNNSQKVWLKKSRLTAMGRLLSSFSDLKIVNSSHNYKCQIRYQLATLGQYDTIMLLDDDMILLDQSFISDMYHQFKKLNEVDILSGHCKLWLDWDKTGFSDVLLNYRQQAINEPIECDIAGPGISMFAKKIIMRQEMLNMTPDYPEATDMGLSLIVNKIFGSRTFYFPVFGRMNFHNDKSKGAISQGVNFEKSKYGIFKKYWQDGYLPALKKNPDLAGNSDLKNKLSHLKLDRHSW